VTDWYCDDWTVETTVHGFNNARDAANFGGGIGPDSASKLRLQEGKLVILTPNGASIPLADTDVVVSKIKPEAVGKVWSEIDDYEVMRVLPRDFHHEPGLCQGFSSMAYGVRDHLGNAAEAICDSLESEEPRGDITSLLALLRALNRPEARVVQASAEFFIGCSVFVLRTFKPAKS
jgi:hypothetical protein